MTLNMEEDIQEQGMIVVLEQFFMEQSRNKKRMLHACCYLHPLLDWLHSMSQFIVVIIGTNSLLTLLRPRYKTFQCIILKRQMIMGRLPSLVGKRENCDENVSDYFQVFIPHKFYVPARRSSFKRIS